jgi:hypothetical protein
MGRDLKIVFPFGAIGSGIALILTAVGVSLNASHIGVPGWLQDIILSLWPASLATMGTEKAGILRAAGIDAFLIFTNGLLYAGIGVFVAIFRN